MHLVVGGEGSGDDRDTRQHGQEKDPAEDPAELAAARELVCQAKEQGLSLTGPDGLSSSSPRQGPRGAELDRRSSYNSCSASFVPPPPEYVAGLLDDLCRFCNGDDLPPIVQAAIAHAQFETIHPFAMATVASGVPSSISCCVAADSPRECYRRSHSSWPPGRATTWPVCRRRATEDARPPTRPSMG